LRIDEGGVEGAIALVHFSVQVWEGQGHHGSPILAHANPADGHATRFIERVALAQLRPEVVTADWPRDLQVIPHQLGFALGLRLRLERVLWTTPWLLDAGDEVGGIVGPP